MSKQDIVTKEYMQNKDVFADVFNYWLYNGECVIEPSQLHILDTTAFSLPYGTDQAGNPVQKYRDVFMALTAMEDEDAAYVLLGIENQTDVHYAMPVRNMLYDALQYSMQVRKAAQSRRMEKASDKNESNAEFLSGFHRGDRLLPVITLVVYFGAEPWDGPLSITEMLTVKRKELLEWVADYRINLISPTAMTEEEIDKFRSSMREVMLYIKYSKDPDKLRTLLDKDERMKVLDWNVANVINTVTNSKLKIKKKERRVNMCEAIEAMRRESREEGIKESTLMYIKKLMKSMNLDAVGAMDVLEIVEEERDYYLKQLEK